MISRYILFIIFGLDALILTIETSHISISYSEANLLYGDFSLLQFLVQTFLSLFGQNDFALRLVMILFHLGSGMLMYAISADYLKNRRDRIWLLVVFLLLPGVVSASLVVNSAGMVIFGLLLFVYLFPKLKQSYLNLILFLFSLIDIGFVYLFLGLFVYYISEKRRYLALYMLLLYALTSYLYGFDVAGAPTGHFLDAIGVYSAIFTPIIFIYLVYSLYRRYFTLDVDVSWYLSTVALILSLVISFRQRVAIEHFAPYLIVALPLAAQSFVSSYKIRLKMYRTRYKLAFVISFVFLVLNTLVVFFNKDLYSLIENPKKHFVYDMHIAKELAQSLKKMGIKCVSTDEKMQKRLQFYRIERCEENILTESALDVNQSNVTISYKNNIVYKANVTKVYNK